jgi:hypothetical protein
MWQYNATLFPRQPPPMNDTKPDNGTTHFGYRQVPLSGLVSFMGGG